MKINELPSLENLNKYFTLDESTGTLYWKVQKANCVKVGSVVGHVNPRGYSIVKLDGVTVRLHRIVYKMYHGVEPEGELDHIDGDKLNNNPENLRLASRHQNNQNIKKQKNNTSGFKNVYWVPKIKKWSVTIKAFGKIYRFGAYLNIEDAAKVAETQREILHREFANG